MFGGSVLLERPSRSGEDGENGLCVHSFSSPRANVEVKLAVEESLFI